ncbi:MAG: hypothetical protein OQK05_13200 [Pseudopelagicola sp.]|nr:hypothetical protein [Pseudopelagicola sp.]
MKKSISVSELKIELEEVWARLDRYSVTLAQLEKSVEDAKSEASNATSRAEEAHMRLDDIENEQ